MADLKPVDLDEARAVAAELLGEGDGEEAAFDAPFAELPDDETEEDAAPLIEEIAAGLEERRGPGARPRGLIAEFQRCAPYLEAALEGSFYSIDDAAKMLAGERVQLWPGERSAALTEFVTYPDGRKEMRAWAAGGDLVELREMVPGMIAAARAAGCTDFMVEGRKGWERALRQYGLRFFAVQLRKRLDDHG